MLDVALIQSLVRKGVVDDRVADYGHLIVDECHHLSAHSFEQVARQAKARFVLGLSATVTRKDGHHPIIFMQCGPVRHRVNARAQAAARPFEHYALVQPTSFQPARTPEPDRRLEFQALYQRACRRRRSQSAHLRRRHASRCATAGPRWFSPSATITWTASSRDSPDGVRHLVVLRAGLGKKQRQAVARELASIARDEPRVILATGKYVGEGFDDPRLDTLFLTLPVSWRARSLSTRAACTGSTDGKREVRIYDYADLNVPMLARMFDRRCRGYEAVGYTVLLPASAIPGWPADVILPSDPVWKRDYSGSVRRLVRDGVDTPLASLFAHVARAVPPDADGRCPRAQCHGGVSLQTAGDACANQGPLRRQRRLADPVRRHAGTWRSTCSVSTHGWLWNWTAPSISPTRLRTAAIGGRTSCSKRTDIWCCRFLAEDVGKELDMVLDAILRCSATEHHWRQEGHTFHPRRPHVTEPGVDTQSDCVDTPCPVRTLALWK